MMKQTKEQEGIANRVCKEQERLASKRGNHESHWQEIAQRIWPAQSKLFQGGMMSRVEGEKRNEQMYDSTAAKALNKFGAVIDSLMTPHDKIWHRVVPSNKLLLKDRQTKLWFEQVNQILFKRRYAPRANFISQNQLNYKMLGAYGNGAVFVDSLRSRSGESIGNRYRMEHLAGVFFRENHQGIIDTVYRKYPSTARQIVKRFTVYPDAVVTAAKDDPDKEFWLIHCVEPREDYDEGRKDIKGMEYGSYYVFIDGKFLLEEGGYRVFPYMVSRYEQVPGELYARSPAMDALPAIKTLNEQKKTVLKQGHKAVDPTLLGHDDGVMDTFNMRPGALNPGGVNADGRPLIHALPVGNIAIGKDLMDDERLDINDHFMVTLFQIMVESPQMTATEVLERAKEKGLFLGPTIGRQYSDSLAFLVDREFDLAYQDGEIPPFPPALLEDGGEYTITWDSPMTQTQRAGEASGFMRVLETAVGIATNTQNPAVLDHFNFDEAIPEIADIHGVPARWMNDVKKIREAREGRAEQAQVEEDVAAAPAAAALVKAEATARKADAEIARNGGARRAAAR